MSESKSKEESTGKATASHKFSYSFKLVRIRKVPLRILETWVRRFITKEYLVSQLEDVVTFYFTLSLAEYYLGQMILEIEKNGFPLDKNYLGVYERINGKLEESRKNSSKNRKG